jgi:hypothetical protein
MMSNNFSTPDACLFRQNRGQNADCEERSAIHAIARRNYVPCGTFRVLRKFNRVEWEQLGSFGDLNQAVHFINTQAPYEDDAMMLVQVLAFLPER